MDSETPSTLWLRPLLRLALTATASTPAPWHTTADLVDPDDPGKDPRFRKLVEAILFSRRFLNTYNLVLLAVLAVFTGWHWAAKTVLHMRKRQRHHANRRGHRVASTQEETWSSSSSTVEGSATPPDATTKFRTVDERSALLPSGSRSSRPTPGIWNPYYKLKAILLYQPSRIPGVNKTLPTNATSLLVLCWIGLILFYNLYQMPLSFTYLFVFADRCGIIFVANLPLLYLFAAKNQPLQLLTGYSYESLNILHRRVGEVMCLQAFIHFFGMVATWYGLLRHLGFTLARFLFNRVVLLGLAAFFAYEAIYFTSLGSFRQRWYELFLALHVVLHVAGLVFLWFHHHTSRPYVGISLVIYLADRILYRLWLRSSTHPATLTILEDEQTVLVSANWEVTKKTSLTPQNMQHGWEPNEHVFITVPALSRKHALQSHPFTIFSAAPTPPAIHAANPNSNSTPSSHAQLRLLIRAQSPKGFTHQLLDHARTHRQTRIRLDGPYGSPHALTTLQASSTAILVAGGSGIAVAYPLLHSLLRPLPNPATPESPPRPHPNVKLLWITRAPTHRLWLPDSQLQDLEDRGLDVLICPPTMLAGRPNVLGILEHWLGAAQELERQEHSRRSSETALGRCGNTGIVVSGPEDLVRDVRNFAARHVWQGRDVCVQVEKFGW